MFGTQDIILIGIIVVVLFGATKLPQLGSGVGQAIRNFKKGMSELNETETPKKSVAKNEEEETNKEK
jgi:sec-independent protein translocase protein TatA